MAADVLPLFNRIGRYIRTIRATNLAQAAITATALPIVFVYASQNRALLAMAILLYGWLKIRQYIRTDRSAKQIRLEERFYRQQMDGPTLRRCADRSDHLWDDSLALRAVRGFVSQPPPRILSSYVKIGRLAREFSVHLGTLVPRVFSPAALIPAAIVVWLLVGFSTADAPRWMSMSIAALVIVGGLEILQIRVVRRTRVLVDHVTHALGSWAFDLLGDDPGESTPSPSYRHELLYRADPVYSAGIATHSSDNDRPPLS